ncbi:RARR2 protein, partial [Centropus bengalensis]|nr:RARR2 protein [Centropus bengalensis]
VPLQGDPSGTFVQLKVHLVQTSCRKKAPQRPNCRALENRRKPTCLVCYKFDTGEVPRVLDKYLNCGPGHHLAVK